MLPFSRAFKSAPCTESGGGYLGFATTSRRLKAESRLIEKGCAIEAANVGVGCKALQLIGGWGGGGGGGAFNQTNNWVPVAHLHPSAESFSRRKIQGVTKQ